MSWAVPLNRLIFIPRPDENKSVAVLFFRKIQAHRFKSLVVAGYNLFIS